MTVRFEVCRLKFWSGGASTRRAQHEMSFNLDFSFLSQDAEAATVLPPAAAASHPHAQQPAQTDQAPPLVVELRASAASSQAAVPDSWTLWDSNKQNEGQEAHQHSAAPNRDGGPGAHPAGTSFTRAFAHMKERPGYEPPKQPQQVFLCVCMRACVRRGERAFLMGCR